MTTTRNTQQKDLILSKLRKLYSHPTAKELHLILKKEMPTIGFATVYRNLEILSKNNTILKLRSKTKQNESRYDGHTYPHIHLICNKCGNIEDINESKVLLEIKDSKFKINKSTTEISGTCSNCIK